MNNIITEWVNNPQRDYSEGVALMRQCCPNKSLVRYFEATSERFGMKKLVYELGKLAGSRQLATLTRPTSAPKPSKPKSKAVEQAKKKTHDAWVEMSKLQNELYDTGTANDEATVAKRKQIMEKRDSIVERYNELYEGKEKFFEGKMSEEELQNVVDGKLPEKEPKKEKSPCSDMTDVQLTKRQHAVQTNITRAQNQLDYQQDKKGKAKNPMPDCPKRTKLEAKLAKLREEQTCIEQEIKKRGL